MQAEPSRALGLTRQQGCSARSQGIAEDGREDLALGVGMGSSHMDQGGIRGLGWYAQMGAPEGPRHHHQGGWEQKGGWLMLP